jgi:hypothetical protein
MRAWTALLTSLMLATPVVLADDVSATTSLVPGACGTSAAPCQPHVTAAKAWELIAYPYSAGGITSHNIGPWSALNIQSGFCATAYGVAPVQFFGTYRSGTQFQTAATINSYAGCPGNNLAANANTIQRPLVIYNVLLGATGGANQRIWLPLKQPSGVAPEATLALLSGAAVPATTTTFVGALFDFGYSLNVQVCSADGVAGSCVDTGIQYAANTNYRVTLDMTIPLVLTASISSTTSTAPDAWTTPVSFTKSTNLPPDGTPILMAPTVTALENLAHSLYVNTIELRWNP